MPESLGQFEQIILTAILSLRDEAYGVTIHEKAVQLAAPKRISLGAVYVTLDRLEDKGLISSWLSDPTPQRGGRSKRFYRLRPSANERSKNPLPLPSESGRPLRKSGGISQKR